MAICVGASRWPEVAYSRHMDLQSSTGLLGAIQAARRIVRGGLLWIGIPCASWVWMSRGSTKRSQLNPRGGKGRFKNVRATNRLVRRVCHLFLANADSKRWPERVTSSWLSNALLRNLVVKRNKPGWSQLTGFYLWDLWEGHVWEICSQVGLFALWGKGGSLQKNWLNRFWCSSEGSSTFQSETRRNTRRR